jgi:hypothetical protein
MGSFAVREQARGQQIPAMALEQSQFGCLQRIPNSSEFFNFRNAARHSEPEQKYLS